MTNGVNLFRQESTKINDRFPSLNYSEEENGHPFIYGEIPLHDSKGGIIDSYSVKIVPTDEYPLKLPFVFETGGRIPINVDWHIFPDGHCCLMSIPQESFICKKGITLTSFIENEVVPYFYNQKHRELYGYFLKERSHGNKGHIEFFQEKFNTTDLSLIAKMLNFIANKKEPKNTDKCFCGGAAKYKKCHRILFREFQLFETDEILLYARFIQNYLIENQ
ncbi:hypothetical protein GCM10027592_62780 [Spirosoma flavus]